MVRLDLAFGERCRNSHRSSDIRWSCRGGLRRPLVLRALAQLAGTNDESVSVRTGRCSGDRHDDSFSSRQVDCWCRVSR